MAGDGKTEYVALLRGVNVGGVTVKMADLADVVRSLGYDDVRTVLASGNVRFSTDAGQADAKAALEAALRARFDYDAWVHVLPLAQLGDIVGAFPFERREGWHAYVVVVMDETTRAELLELGPELDADDEQLAPGDGVIYWSVERGHTLDSRFGKAQSKSKHKPWLTTRNLNTLDKLLR